MSEALSSQSMLCRLGDIADGGAKGVMLGSGDSRLELILLRRGKKVFAYENRCPHLGTPLETFPDKFLDQTGELLICSTHGARFRVDDGACIEGPCKGQSLRAVANEQVDGAILLKHL